MSGPLSPRAAVAVRGRVTYAAVQAFVATLTVVVALGLWAAPAQAAKSWQGQQAASTAVAAASSIYGLPGGGEALVSYNPSTYESSLQSRAVGGATSAPVNLGINVESAPSFDASGNAIFVGTAPGDAYLAVSYWDAATDAVTVQDAPVIGYNEPETPSIVEHADGSAWLTWDATVYSPANQTDSLEVYGVFRPAGQAEFDLTNGIHALYTIGTEPFNATFPYTAAGMFSTYAANSSSELVVGYGLDPSISTIVAIASTGTSTTTGPSFAGASPQTISSSTGQIDSYSTTPDGTSALLYNAASGGGCDNQYAASISSTGTLFNSVAVGQTGSLADHDTAEIAVDPTNDAIILEFTSLAGSDCDSEPPQTLFAETATPTDPLGPAPAVASDAFNPAVSADGGTEALIYSQCTDESQCYGSDANPSPDIQYNTYGVVNGSQTLLSTETSGSQNRDLLATDGLGNALATWRYQPDPALPGSTLESNDYDDPSAITTTPTPTPTPTLTPPLTPTPTTPVVPTPAQLEAEFGALLDPTGQTGTVSAIATNGGINVNVTNPQAGTFVAIWASITGGAAAAQSAALAPAAKNRTTIVARVNATTAKAGKIKVKMRLTAAGKRLFRAAIAKHQRLRLTSVVTFTPKGSRKHVTATRTFTLKH
jgi:hypothetical protein